MTSSNPFVRRVTVMLEKAGKKGDAPIWKAAADLLSGSRAVRVEVNLGRVSRKSEEGQAIFVPGKVLGAGLIDKKLIVGALSFSSSARSKLESAGGSALTIEEFLKRFPEGEGVKLVR